MSIIILSSIIFGIGAYLAFKATRNIISPVFITIGAWFFAYIGGIIVFLTKGHVLTLLFISIGVMFYGLGAIFSKVYLGFKPTQELTRFRKSPFFSVFPDQRVFFTSLAVIFLISVAFIAYYYYIVGIPLFVQDIPAHKMTKAMGRGIFIRAVDTFLPVVILIAYISVKARNTLSAKMFMCITAITGIIVIVFTATRGAAIGYIVPIIIVYGLISRKFNWFRLSAVFLIFFTAAIWFQYRYVGCQEFPLKDALLVFGNRMTMVQTMGVDYIINELVPRKGFFIGEIAWNEFKGILATLRILPEHPIPFSVTLFEMMQGSDPRAAFAMTILPIGDLYIDFGVPGIILGMFLFGVIAQMLYIITIRYCKDYFILPVMVYLQYVLLMSHFGGSLSGIFANHGISLIVIATTIIGLTVMLLLPSGKVFIRLPIRLSRRKV